MRQFFSLSLFSKPSKLGNALCLRVAVPQRHPVRRKVELQAIPYEEGLAHSFSLAGKVSNLVIETDGNLVSGGTFILAPSDPEFGANLKVLLSTPEAIAQTSSEEIQEGDTVCVVGKLRVKHSQRDGSETVMELHVLADDVQRFHTPEEAVAHGLEQEQERQLIAEETSAIVLSEWDTFFQDTSQWYDNREDKRSPTAPDFKHKYSEAVLWESSCPIHLRGNLPPKSSDLWQQLLERPGEWTDWRLNKPSPKYPDFTKIGTGEALWDGPRTPTWVREKLHSEVLPFSTTGYQTSRYQDDDKWRRYFDNPEQWYDNRRSKRNPRAPDFRHKNGSDVLWLSSAPSWAHEHLGSRGPEKAQAATATPVRHQEDAKWQALLNSPNEWYDNRLGKFNAKAPDFKHKTSGEALWLDSAPSWAKEQLAAVGSLTPGGSSLTLHLVDDKWRRFFDDPADWYDNRQHKTNPKAPDFKNKSSNDGLWVSSAPSWVHESLAAAGLG